jgi:N-acetylneuraminic acid mutarotase
MTMRSRFGDRNRLAVAILGAVVAGLLPAFAFVAPVGAAAGLGPPYTWVPTGQMHVAQAGQTATVLPDGTVLVAGGGTAKAELYNPATRTFSPTASLPVPVTDATATLLPDGKVLVAGGLHDNHQVASAELYNPATGTWSPTGSMTVARSGQTATLLKDGEVLAAGGGCNGSGYGCDAGSFEAPLHSAEIYNPATGTWTRTGSMRFGRQFFTATLLPGGDVLAAGGFAECDDDMCSDNRSAELYDPTTGKWSVTGSMRTSRDEQSATLLGNGEVLVAGGFTQEGFGSGHNLSDAELYNPATGTWSPTASMVTARSGQTATLLSNGWVLVAGGGTTSAEIYEPGRAIWVAPGAMGTARTDAAATLLPGGHVLMTGGDGPDGQPLASAEEFLAGPGPLVAVTPASVAFGGQQVGTSSGSKTYQVTNVGTADLMASGVTVTGTDPSDYRASTDCTRAAVPAGETCTVSVRFAPRVPGLRTAAVALSDNAPLSPQGPAITGYGVGPNAWTPVGPMSSAREDFSATLLPDGKVLMAGGQTDLNSLASAELYDPVTRSFSATGSLNDARAFPAATLLRNGQVLIAGGLATSEAVLSSAELYNPATGTWSLTTPMQAAGYRLTSTLLPSGSVLVTGFSGTNTAEVYNPANATWTNTGPMTASQGFATATLLPDGEVLLAAGGTSAAELYNSTTNDWTATGALKVARQGAVAALLPDGKVLVAGGETVTGKDLASAELYNPATGTWHATGSMRTGRYGATATLLPNGQVLVTGGCTSQCLSSEPGLASAEVYNGFWVQVASMTQRRVFQTATLLPGGTVLVAGGGTNFYSAATATAEFYTTTLLSLNPTSGPAGAQVTVTGSGFYAHETAIVSWGNLQAVLTRVKTSPSGTFVTKITIPKSPAGVSTVSARGSQSFAGASATFTVTR